MTFGDKLNNEYFEWMYDLVCGERYNESISYRKLITYLHTVEFIYLMRRDRNRAEDGLGLRGRFAYSKGYDKEGVDVYYYIDMPCSVLEMILALAIRCEESIMDDPTIGDRTRQWFWGMISNLGLGSMTDDRFDIDIAKNIINKFLNREYEPNGKGGLFTVNCNTDLRNVEIWYQMNWYLDRIV